MQKSDQNVEKNKSYETFYRDSRHLNSLNNRNKLIELKLLFDRDARGNKLCPCKIPDPYLKKTKKSLNFKNSDNFGSKKKKKAISTVYLQTLKIANTSVYNTKKKLQGKIIIINYDEDIQFHL